MISGKQIWWASVFCRVLTRDKHFIDLHRCILIFAGVVPLKNKSGETLVNGFQLILDLGRSPEKLQTDKGPEFLNCNFQSLLKENNIHFFTINSELKASVVERFNRTLKTRRGNISWQRIPVSTLTFCRISYMGIIILINEA